jgi:zinc protease
MAKEGQWREGLDQAYAILADALKAPPALAEIDRELKNLRTAWVAAVQGEPTRLSQATAMSLVTAVDRNDVVAAAPAMLSLFDLLAPQMTPDAVEAEMRAMFAGEGPRLVMLSPTPLQGLGEALAAAEKAAPAARQSERQVSLDDLPAPGAPGRELSRQRIEDLGVTIVRFANGSSLVFKQTDFEKGSVNVELRFGAGRSGLPADRKTLAWAAPVLGSTGVGPLDLDGLERLLTGRRMTIGFDMADDSWELAGATDAAELGDQLRLLAAKLVAPHWDPALVDRYRASGLENFDLSFSSASSRIGREFGGVTHPATKGGRRSSGPTSRPSPPPPSKPSSRRSCSRGRSRRLSSATSISTRRWRRCRRRSPLCRRARPCPAWRSALARRGRRRRRPSTIAAIPTRPMRWSAGRLWAATSTSASGGR